MISLTCTHCSATLTMDDAFAGGVCRCQHCGTIQTVPAKDAGNGGKGGSAASAQQQKALYQRRGRAAAADPAGSGLDELADIVASSGLSNLSNKVNRPATIARAAEPDAGGARGGDRRNLTLLLVGGGAAIAVILGLIAWLIVNGNRNAGAVAAGDPAVSATPGAPAGNQPGFLDIPLQGNSVIYVVDCGQSAEEFFGLTKNAVLRSAESLGTGRKFQIVFWDNGAGKLQFTPAIPSPPGAKTLEQVRQVFDSVIPQGQSDAQPALQHAFDESPSDVVLITAKGSQLDDAFVEMTEAVRKRKPRTKIHAVSLGVDAKSAALNTAATNTGGKYREATRDDLSAFAG